MYSVVCLWQPVRRGTLGRENIALYNSVSNTVLLTHYSPHRVYNSVEEQGGRETSAKNTAKYHCSGRTAVINESYTCPSLSIFSLGVLTISFSQAYRKMYMWLCYEVRVIHRYDNSSQKSLILSERASVTVKFALQIRDLRSEGWDGKHTYGATSSLI